VSNRTDAAIDAFLAGPSFAVVGASADRSKYGNKVLRSYLQAGRRVYPVNPKLNEIEGERSYPDLASLPERVHGVSIVTPPAVTETIVEQAAAAGIRHLWMQPGAESEAAIARANELGIELIHSGPCVLVAQGFREDGGGDGGGAAPP
jgi:predicted CoA-binding protein